MPQVHLLHNPASAKGRKVTDLLRRILAENPALSRNLDIDWVSLKDLPRTASEFSRFIVIGGDGTVNAGTEFLVRNDLNVPLGIVPAGTGNNLCSGLGLPPDPVEAFRIALTSERIRPLDVIRIDTPDRDRPTYMVQTSALGFPARICGQYDRLRRQKFLGTLSGTLGRTVYRVLALFGLASQKIREKRGIGLLEIVCRFPEIEIRETALAVVIGNERSTGGDFIPCPQAAPDDGMIDVCLVKAGTGASYLSLFRSVAKGTHVGKYEAVWYRQTEGPLEIELAEASPLLVDGDLPLTSDRYQFHLLPGRLKTVVA